MAAIPVLFSMAEPARPLNIPDSLDINEAAPSKPREQLASLRRHRLAIALQAFHDVWTCGAKSS